MVNKQAGENLLLELAAITLLVSLTSQQAHEGECASLEGLMNTKVSDILQKNQMALNYEHSGTVFHF